MRARIFRKLYRRAAQVVQASYRCKLCWRVTSVVFASIMVVEAIVLLPSFWQYRDGRIEFYAATATAAVSAAFSAAPRAGAELSDLDAAMRGAANDTRIVGLRLLDAECRSRVVVGTKPPEGPRASCGNERRVSYDSGNIVVSVPVARIGVGAVEVVVDGRHLRADLVGFVTRISGLVAIISAVVTVTTMLMLQILVLGRLVMLDEFLSRVAPNATGLRARSLPPGPRDELGSVIAHFNGLLHRLGGAMAFLQQKETQLQRLNLSLEDTVRERTGELERAKDAAERSNKAKTDFLANMSHELRTPLNAIIGFSEIMKVETFGPMGNTRYAEYACDIHGSGRHLLSIVDMLLNMTAIESGRFALAEEAFESLDPVDEVLRMARPMADERGIRLETGEVEPATLFGDRQLLRQALANLAVNAIKFTPEHAGKTIILSGRHGSLGYEFAVADEGIGIPADKIDLVLSAFGQVEAVRSRKFGGVGLGLPFALRIAIAHGGALELESEVGVGTTARLRLPASRLRAPGGSAGLNVSAAASV